MPNQYVNKVAVNGSTIIDLTGDTVTAADVAQGKTFHLASGASAVGTAVKNGSVYQDENGYVVLDDEPGANVSVTPLSVTENGTYTAPTGTAYSPVTVDVAVQPSGIKYLYSDIDGEGAWTGLSNYEYVSYDYAPVGDNKCRLWIELESDDLSFTFPISVPTYSSYRYSGVIDWGDGTSSEYSYGNLNNTHTYTKSGRYAVTAWRTGGAELFSIASISTDKNKILAAEIWMLGYPTNTMNINAATKLKKVVISNSQTKAGNITACPALEQIILPNTITTLAMLYNNSAMKKITIPSSVTTIETACFSGWTGMKEYHFLPATPPTLGNANVFANIPSDCIIYVPQGSLEAYQTAENWSTYASYIQEEVS